MDLGYVQGVTRDYKRHGITTLSAVLTFNGAVLATYEPRRRHQEFAAFLCETDKAVPAELDGQCIVDNCATHSHPKVRALLAGRTRRHMHFVQPPVSWLNQVERYFALSADKAKPCGSLTSVE
jgi:putative transposase